MQIDCVKTCLQMAILVSGMVYLFYHRFRPFDLQYYNIMLYN